MTLDGLLALIAVVVAIYAIPRPSTRESIKLFAPLWLLLSSILIPAVAIIAADCVDKLSPWQLLPGARFLLEKVAFLLPVGVFCFAGYSWWRAKLQKGHEKKFKGFIATCQRDGDFAELVRIVENNQFRLPSLFERETLYRLFDSRFVHRMVEARCWVHLKLLSIERMQGAMPDFRWAVRVVLNEMLASEVSPLRSKIISGDGRPEEFEETELLEKTFHNPKWYIPGCQINLDGILVRLCSETLKSGKFDNDYNRGDKAYSSEEGGATRISCPLFMVVKIYLISVRRGADEDIPACTYCLVRIFQLIAERSQYNRGKWESGEGISDYPTPFAYILYEILAELKNICDNERDVARESGADPNATMINRIIPAWADCIFWLEQRTTGKSDVTIESRPVSREFAEIHMKSFAQFLVESFRHHGKDSNWTVVPLRKIREEIGRSKQADGIWYNVLCKMSDERGIHQDDALEGVINELFPQKNGQN